MLLSFVSVSNASESCLKSDEVKALVEKFMSISIVYPCISIFKQGMQSSMMVDMFRFYEKHEGKPYLSVIVENWLKNKRVGYCEGSWEHGDLNADGRVDYNDFAIYVSTVR
jgi:hypothetical protein